MTQSPPPEKHSKVNEVVRDVIIGMSDGLTVPFALAAGLSGAVSSTSIIIAGGLAEIVAGSISMGLGGYLAAKSDSDHYYSEQQKEYDEIKMTPDQEKKEVSDILKTYGLSDVHIASILKNFESNHDAWVDFMMKNELRLDEPEKRRAVKSAGTIALSYIVGGIIPLTPYFFTPDPHTGLLISAGVTLIALFIFGYLKSRFIGSNPWKGAVQTLLIGGIAATAAYLLAKAVS